MNPRAWKPIEDMIAELKGLAEADVGEWLGRSHLVEALAVVTPGSPAPINLQLMAAAAKNIARQMPHAPAINHDELRGIARALANVLKNGMDSHISELGDAAKPYYLRGEA